MKRQISTKFEYALVAVPTLIFMAVLLFVLVRLIHTSNWYY